MINNTQNNIWLPPHSKVGSGLLVVAAITMIALATILVIGTNGNSAGYYFSGAAFFVSSIPLFAIGAAGILSKR